MIKVLKHGQFIKKVTCPFCKALLSYNGSDIRWKYESPNYLNPYSRYYRYIVCPDCGEDIIIKLKND